MAVPLQAVVLAALLSGTACTGTTGPDAVGEPGPSTGSPSAPATRSYASAPPATQAPAAASTPGAPPRAPRFALPRVPDGYRAENFPGSQSSAEVQTVLYLPMDEARRGERISIVASTLALPEFLASYGLQPTAETTTVRSGKRAVEYAVGDPGSPSARRALVWQEGPGLLNAVFAFGGIKTLRPLAEQMQRAD